MTWTFKFTNLLGSLAPIFTPFTSWLYFSNFVFTIREIFEKNSNSYDILIDNHSNSWILPPSLCH